MRVVSFLFHSCGCSCAAGNSSLFQLGCHPYQIRWDSVRVGKVLASRAKPVHACASMLVRIDVSFRASWRLTVMGRPKVRGALKVPEACGGLPLWRPDGTSYIDFTQAKFMLVHKNSANGTQGRFSTCCSACSLDVSCVHRLSSLRGLLGGTQGGLLALLAVSAAALAWLRTAAVLRCLKSAVKTRTRRPLKTA